MTDANLHPTREGWLLALIDLLRPMMTAAGYEPPDKLRISCGFPSTRALSNTRRRIGECWAFEAAEDGYVNILISPTLADPVRIADVLVHELLHATGLHGHKKDFAKAAKSVGLEGKPTATYAGQKLAEDLKKLTESLGPYPHGALDKTAGPVKKQTSRMLKITCVNPEEHSKPYIVRASKSTISVGLPTCPCGNEMVPADEGEEEPE